MDDHFVDFLCDNMERHPDSWQEWGSWTVYDPDPKKKVGRLSGLCREISGKVLKVGSYPTKSLVVVVRVGGDVMYRGSSNWEDGSEKLTEIPLRSTWRQRRRLKKAVARCLQDRAYRQIERMDAQREGQADAD